MRESCTAVVTDLSTRIRPDSVPQSLSEQWFASDQAVRAKSPTGVARKAPSMCTIASPPPSWCWSTIMRSPPTAGASWRLLPRWCATRNPVASTKSTSPA